MRTAAVRRLHRGCSTGVAAPAEEKFMRKLVVTTFVTMDGVMQAPGGAGEDPSGGFSYEGWLVPFFDEAMGEQMNEWFAGAEDFLLGRTTYEIFYGAWPQMISDDPVSQGLNFKRKYVASHTLTSVEWRPQSCCRATSATPSGSSRTATAGNCRYTGRRG
jgi:dihydrofolate reductase